MLLLVIIVAVAAFLFGFLLGVVNEPQVKPTKTKYSRTEKDKNIEKLKNEYMNFLTYDGSEQA